MKFYLANALLSFAMVSYVSAKSACGDLKTCDECLNDDAICAWTAGECRSSCDIADASCYTKYTFEDKNSSETCKVVDQDKRDYKLCAKQRDCGLCTQTYKSDGSPCQWFDLGEIQYCGSKCDMDGCGETTCSERCGRYSTCHGCLNSWDFICAWTGGECHDDCDLADAACYTKYTYKELNGSETCEKIN